MYLFICLLVDHSCPFVNAVSRDHRKKIPPQPQRYALAQLTATGRTVGSGLRSNSLNKPPARTKLGSRGYAFCVGSVSKAIWKPRCSML